MISTQQFLRAGSVLATIVVAVLACTDTPKEGPSAFPTSPSLAKGGSINVNLDQCANNVPRGGNCTWQNGDLNGSNSQYAEGLTVPFRLSIDGLSVGAAYTFHINYDWTAGGHKAYDFLGSFNATEQVDKCSSGGGGIPLRCVDAAGTGLTQFTTFAMPENNFPIPNVGGVLSVGSTTQLPSALSFAASGAGGGLVGLGEHLLTLYGGTITSVSDPSHLDNKGLAVDAGDLTGNTEADIVVTFTASQTSVLFLWSGHLAQSAYWDQPGTPNGAGQVSGAPWHMRTQQLQTVSGTSAGNKNQDRSIQPSALVQPPDLTLAKVADATTVSAGSAIGFTMTVHNNGPGSANNVVLTDVLPTNSGLSWSISPSVAVCAIATGTLTCNFGTLASGADASVHITSSTTTATCGTVNNTAQVTLDNGAAPPNANASVTVQCPNLSLAKSSTVTAVNAGAQVNYTVSVTNGGPGSASGVTIADNLPTAGTDWSIQTQSPANSCSISGNPGSEVLNCGPLSLASGASVSVTVVSNTTTASCPSLSNTASATATGTTVTGSPAGPVAITVNCPNLSLGKQSTISTVNAGEQVGYTVTVTNGGAGSASGVTISDNLPTAGTDWSIQTQSPANSCSISGNPGSEVLNCGPLSLASGASVSVTVVSNTTTASCPSLSNTATASATGTTVSGSPAGPVVITVNCPTLSLAKSSTVTSVNLGAQVNYTVAVSNTGPGSASGVTITDNLPGGGTDWSIQTQSPANSCSISGNPGSEVLNCGPLSLASGASVSVTVVSGTTTASCPKLSNTASATATGTTVSGSPAGPVDITVNCPTLSLAKSSTVTAVSAGEQVNYTVTVSNAGPGSASGVTITDNLPTAGTDWSIQTQSPANSCTITGNPGSEQLSCGPLTLASGGSVSVKVVSATTAASCPSMSNTATASANLTTVSNSPAGPVAITVNCPNLTIVKTPNAGTVSPNGTATFTITVSNTGPGTAFNVQVSDTLPEGLTWTDDHANCDVTPKGGSGPNRVLSCPKLGPPAGAQIDLASGGSITVHVSATIPAGFTSNPPSNSPDSIEVDGDLVDNPARPAKDWATLGISCSGTIVGCDIDITPAQNDNSFGEGTKEDDVTPTAVTGSIPPNKSDLTRFYVATRRLLTHDFLYLAWTRVQAPSGTTNMDFELNQSAVLLPAGVPTRTAGDVLIMYDLANGGTVPTLAFSRWVASGSKNQCEAANATPCWGKRQALSAQQGVLGAINTSQVSDPVFGGNLDALTFGEASVDLQGANIFPAGQCISFGSAYLKSRSSDSFTSAIKDFIAPIQINVTNCSPVPLPNTAFARHSLMAAGTYISDDGLITVQSASASILMAPLRQQLAWMPSSGNTAVGSIAAVVDPIEMEYSRQTTRARSASLRVEARAGVGAQQDWVTARQSQARGRDG